MTFAIAAAGTGGHVFPALAVAEALRATGVPPDEIVFYGGDRFEADAVPGAGYPFVRLPLQGLRRSLSMSNLRLPFVLRDAVRLVRRDIVQRDVRVVLATGGYVTVPAGWGARREGVPFFVQEQNADAGLANRVMSRWARQAFTAFPDTHGLSNATYVGNPVRPVIAEFSREDLRAEAQHRYNLDAGLVTVGVVGGSLGAGAINEAIAAMVHTWDGPPLQIVHLAGRSHAERYGELAVSASSNPRRIRWEVVPFETDMHLFFAAIDLAVARSGGMVAELTATSTPSVLVPGGFGSKGHQHASAAHLLHAGAAAVLPEEDLHELPRIVAELVRDEPRRSAMAGAAAALGRPRAARDIAEAMLVVHA